MPTTSYAIAIGSNRRGRHGAPEREVAAAMRALGGVVTASAIVRSAPLGPSIRRFAKAVVMVETRETPPELLARLKGIERAFGRRRGQRWGARVIDLDIISWSGGRWTGRDLIVPHAAFRTRRFVLDTMRTIVAAWRDPVTGLTIRHLAYRAQAVDRRALRP